jgi:transposase
MAQSKKFTDKQIIDAFLETRSYAAAADMLGTFTTSIKYRCNELRRAGVSLPGTANRRGPTKYTDKYVSELNDYVKQQTTRGQA